MNKEGNHMMTSIDRDPKPNPDNYRVCSDCSEQNHVEDVERIGGKTVCRWCFAKDEAGHEFTCNKENWEFKAGGIPTECPHCGSWYIEHATSRVSSWINEAQTEKIYELSELNQFLLRMLKIGSPMFLRALTDEAMRNPLGYSAFIGDIQKRYPDILNVLHTVEVERTIPGRVPGLLDLPQVTGNQKAWGEIQQDIIKECHRRLRLKKIKFVAYTGTK